MSVGRFGTKNGGRGLQAAFNVRSPPIRDIRPKSPLREESDQPEGQEHKQRHRCWFMRRDTNQLV